VLELGVPSSITCPECHGSLVEIREGSIVRFRCHTGHASSLHTLLAETEVAIEKSLWNTVRALEERSFLRQTMERRAREAGELGLAEQLAVDAARDREAAERVRRLVAGPAAAYCAT
jgi:two-component system, chemotaxis family, protein-glutamate methylesterase/glutaminase